MLAQAIAPLSLPCLITVTTESARSLYPISPNLQLWVGTLQPDTLPGFLQQHQITGILDASHPFAVAVSEMAIAASQQFQIPYLRYERATSNSQTIQENLLEFDSFEALLDQDIVRGERVLLTIGYRSLPLFQAWQTQATLFARILPSAVALEAALAAGFTPDRLMAMRPPFSLELERSLWQHWQISMVVTKASGAPGGEEIKRQLAEELGVKLVVITRPVVQYPEMTGEVAIALKFCQKHSTIQH